MAGLFSCSAMEGKGWQRQGAVSPGGIWVESWGAAPSVSTVDPACDGKASFSRDLGT